MHFPSLKLFLCIIPWNTSNLHHFYYHGFPPDSPFRFLPLFLDFSPLTFETFDGPLPKSFSPWRVESNISQTPYASVPLPRDPFCLPRVPDPSSLQVTFLVDPLESITYVLVFVKLFGSSPFRLPGLVLFFHVLFHFIGHLPSTQGALAKFLVICPCVPDRCSQPSFPLFCSEVTPSQIREPFAKPLS